MQRALRGRVARGFLLIAAIAAGSLAIVAACSEPPGTDYANPSGLRRDNLPGEAGAAPLVCGGDAGADAASAGGPCAVSWSKDIFPSMAADGAWKCASAGKCHGGAQAPQINASSADTAYESLRGYMISGSPYPYINPDASDPSQSTIECNLHQSCGSPMPIAPGTPLTDTELCKLDVWVRCGAPKN
jgi:hypothetical protein